LVFTGTYEHTIDAKNRLALGRELRSQIQRSLAVDDDQGVILYVVPGDRQPAGPTLRLYTESAFEQRASQLDHSQLDPQQLLEYEEILFSLVHQVEIDKQGRVLLPQPLIERAQLSSEVVLIGVKDHIVVRDRSAWIGYLEQKIAADPQLLMNPRQAMGRIARESGGN
jgi:MraZ protein